MLVCTQSTWRKTLLLGFPYLVPASLIATFSIVVLLLLTNMAAQLPPACLHVRMYVCIINMVVGPEFYLQRAGSPLAYLVEISTTTRLPAS